MVGFWHVQDEVWLEQWLEPLQKFQTLLQAKHQDSPAGKVEVKTRTGI